MLVWTVLLLVIGWVIWKRDSLFSRHKSTREKDREKNLEKKTKPQVSEEKKEAAGERPSIQPGSKQLKNKVEHPFFFKSFKKNESNIMDFDFSTDNRFMVIASKDTNHVVYSFQSDKVFKFSSGKIPKHVSISETGQLIAMDQDYKIAVFKFDGEKVVHHCTFEACQDNLIGVGVFEEPEFIITGGSNHHCNFHLFDANGFRHKTVRGDVFEAPGFMVDKTTRRTLYFSESSDVRLFRPTFTSKLEFKDFSKEHGLYGHKSAVCSISYNEEGNRAYTLSLDKTVREWDLSPAGFQDTQIKNLHTFPISDFCVEQPSIIQWSGHDKDTRANIITIAHDYDLYFYRLLDDQLTLLEKIENAHNGEFIKGVKYIYKPRSDKHGVVFTRSDKKLFSWKPKL